MELNEISKIVIGLFGGGAIGVFLTYLLGNRKQSQSEFVILLTSYKKMYDELKEELSTKIASYDTKLEIHSIQINQLKDLVSAKEQQITQLRNQLMIFESSHSDVPIPMWLKDTSGVMLFVNKDYEEKLLNPIGKSAKDYLGNTDESIWGEKAGKQFTTHDKKVMKSRCSEEFVESWKGPGGDIWEGRIIKYPRFAGRTVIGIGGIVIEMWRKGNKVCN